MGCRNSKDSQPVQQQRQRYGSFQAPVFIGVHPEQPQRTQARELDASMFKFVRKLPVPDAMCPQVLATCVIIPARNPDCSVVVKLEDVQQEGAPLPKGVVRIGSEIARSFPETAAHVARPLAAFDDVIPEELQRLLGLYTGGAEDGAHGTPFAHFVVCEAHPTNVAAIVAQGFGLGLDYASFIRVAIQICDAYVEMSARRVVPFGATLHELVVRFDGCVCYSGFEAAVELSQVRNYTNFSCLMMQLIK